MDYILTLNKINRSDTDIVGFRAVDLAELNNKKVNMPICFVIKSSLFEDFLEKNDLKKQLKQLTSSINYSEDESLEEACAKIKDLILNTEFSKDVENNLVEAYETLAIDVDHIDIAKLVMTIEKPFLTIIGSPNYLQDSENNESVFQNIRGKKSLLSAVKNCWISLYTPKSLKYREKNNIKADEKMALIVQRMIESDISAQTYADSENIVVKTFYGFQDYYNEFEKDSTIFSKETLSVKNLKVNFQEYQFARNTKDDLLVKKALKEEGDKQKLNDKDVEEIARITKRLETFINNPIKAFFTITKGKIYLLFANRIFREEKEEIADTTKDKLKVEETNINDDVEFLKEIEKYEEDNINKESPNEEQKKEFGMEEQPKESIDKNREEESKEEISEEQSAEETSITNEKTEDSIKEVFEWANSESKEEIDVKSEEEKPLEKNDSFEALTDEKTEQNKEEIMIHKPKLEEEPEQKTFMKESEKETNTFKEQKKEIKEYEEIPSEDSETFKRFTYKPEEIPINEEQKKSEEEVKEEQDEIKTSNLFGEEDKEFIFSDVVSSDEKLELKEEGGEKHEENTQDPFKKIEETNDLIKKIVLLRDETIFYALKKKQKEVIGSVPENFDDAIKNLGSNIRIPFVDEIKKIHKLKESIDNGQEVEIEEAIIAPRTAKNFLIIFS